MLSARAIEPGASTYEMQVGVEFLPGPSRGNLVFDDVDLGWGRCNSKGRIEIEIEKVDSATIVFTANTLGLSFEGFVLIPLENHLGRIPSSEGFHFSMDSHNLFLSDQFLGSRSLGVFAYQIFYRVELPSTRVRDSWDPEIVNRGGIGDDLRRTNLAPLTTTKV